MAKRKFERVYQLRITLTGVEPPVWRRIQVPESYTFWDLHVAIQDAMGWTDCHLHAFRATDSQGQPAVIGIPSEDGFGGEFLAGWEESIADYLQEGTGVVYEYDFGDGWEHEVVAEEIVPRKARVRYPKCLDGARACPPEDVGGVFGYQDFLEAIADPKHEEHETLLEWIGGSFDPEDFDSKKVRFDDPDERREFVFGYLG